MSSFPRLLGYSRRYSGRFVVAFAAMLLYAAATAGVASLIKPIIDEGLRPTGTGGALPDPDRLTFWSGAVLAAYLAKGIGAYFSAYLMTDIGQRVVREVDRAALLAVVEWRRGAGFLECRRVLLVDAEVQRVVGHHAQHHPLAEHAGLAEHPAQGDATERREAGPHAFQPLEDLAKYYEHRARDLERAEQAALEARSRLLDGRIEVDTGTRLRYLRALDHRLDRLRRRRASQG